MGLLNDVVKVGTLGLVDDVTGEEAAAAAASSGRKFSAQAKEDILGELGESWDEIKGYMEPFLQDGRQLVSEYRKATGASANSPIFENFDFDHSKMEQNPAYQFVRDQGLQAVNRAQATNRGLGSGNRMAAVTDYASGLASREYGNEFNRQLQQFQVNQGAKQLNYGVQRNKIGDIGNLLNMSSGTAGNLASFRQNLSNMRTGALSNYAAEQTAASLIPAQQKMNFMNNLVSAGGQLGAAAIMKPTPA